MDNPDFCPTLSVCVLTQNNVRTIGACLDSVAELADEIIVVDSGSTDGTIAETERYPHARTIQHTFRDISSQRNVYLPEAKMDWILSIDADELLGVSAIDEIPRLMQNRETQAYSFPRYWLASTDPLAYVDNGLTYPDFQLRLVRNQSDLSFEGKVHQLMKVSGPQRQVAGPHLFHLHYLINDRSQREARLAQYERLQVGSGSGGFRGFYAYEDTDFEIRPCVETAGADLSDFAEASR
jgi:glycosyltransferase involved in cell wall biosynthesis